jgi:hypothetical protein
MTKEQRIQISVLIETVKLDEYDVDELFYDTLGLPDFIFPEDIGQVNQDGARKIIGTLLERCLE